VKQEAAAKHQQLGQERALDMLPGTFEVLRAVYGDRGPCVKPQAEVRTYRRHAVMQVVLQEPNLQFLQVPCIHA